MSKTVREIQFQCGHDHSQTEGCTGHVLRYVADASSDTVSVFVDNELRFVMDDDTFGALLKVATPPTPDASPKGKD